MLIDRFSRNVQIGLSSLWAHKLRSGLTTLGIVFGVASVICMLAIGEGLSYEARAQIQRLGSNNIIIRSVKPPATQQVQSTAGPGPSVLQYGLTYADVERIATTVPSVRVIVPSREIRKDIRFYNRSVEGTAVGTVPWYPAITGGRVVAGRFITTTDMRSAANVCVLSRSLVSELGGLHDPLNDVVRVGTDPYRVVGILDTGGPVQAGGPEASSRAGRELYIPLSAARQRFGELIVERQAGSMTMERVELHEAIAQVADSDQVLKTAEVVEVLLKRSHEKRDYEMIVPLQLLLEKERVKRLYNIVLGLMAAISLLVGGIGIMNIMLASVSERTPEIGIRRAIGAKKRDILTQFLTETILLSGLGGLVGILLGVSMPRLITYMTAMTTIVTAWAILLAFGISALVGLVFGYYPALRAANMDPIVALRHE